MINPDLERAMAKTIHAKTAEVAASHVSMVSQPQIVARTIEQAIAVINRSDSFGLLHFRIHRQQRSAVMRCWRHKGNRPARPPVDQQRVTLALRKQILLPTDAAPRSRGKDVRLCRSEHIPDKPCRPMLPVTSGFPPQPACEAGQKGCCAPPQGCAENPKARHAVKRITHNKKRPAIPEQVNAAGNGTIFLFYRISGHHLFSSQRPLL
jgi:hypothetical protein